MLCGLAREIQNALESSLRRELASLFDTAPLPGLHLLPLSDHGNLSGSAAGQVAVCVCVCLSVCLLVCREFYEIGLPFVVFSTTQVALALLVHLDQSTILVS